MPCLYLPFYYILWFFLKKRSANGLQDAFLHILTENFGLVKSLRID